MTLTPNDVLRSITRFLPLLRMDEHEIQGYTATIVEACGWMQPLHFEETCREMLKEIAPGRKPVPKQYIAVYNRLAEKNRWRKNKDAKCIPCGGTGFLYGRYRHRETQEIITAVNPCPSCSPNANQELKPELEPLVEHESYMLKTAREMPPGGAKWVISQVEAGKIKFPDDVILALMENASREPAPVTPPPPAIAHAIANVTADTDGWELPND